MNAQIRATAVSGGASTSEFWTRAWSNSGQRIRLSRVSGSWARAASRAGSPAAGAAMPGTAPAPVRSNRTCMSGEMVPSVTVVLVAYSSMQASATVSRRRYGPRYRRSRRWTRMSGTLAPGGAGPAVAFAVALPGAARRETRHQVGPAGEVFAAILGARGQLRRIDQLEHDLPDVGTPAHAPLVEHHRRHDPELAPCDCDHAQQQLAAGQVRVGRIGLAPLRQRLRGIGERHHDETIGFATVAGVTLAEGIHRIPEGAFGVRHEGRR